MKIKTIEMKELRNYCARMAKETGKKSGKYFNMAKNDLVENYYEGQSEAYEDVKKKLELLGGS
jgi:hypothetical protein